MQIFNISTTPLLAVAGHPTNRNAASSYRMPLKNHEISKKSLALIDAGFWKTGFSEASLMEATSKSIQMQQHPLKLSYQVIQSLPQGLSYTISRYLAKDETLLHINSPKKFNMRTFFFRILMKIITPSSL